ncbi:tetratricopeptide repeat protein [Pleionea litopenaei]|uniref:Tetratricopeptide repeat protein n=1 Tax=Pleionea litopenaei TaxID=3070815 RepID=A0AA51RQJ8_9GAMM|nr:tetratricopeptide repeat protein [Pleionea sp. HL-JVS1]WMS85639.1 hypothetical protein Q9312_10480 [Pleionea sp. HL-JVS1]
MKHFTSGLLILIGISGFIPASEALLKRNVSPEALHALDKAVSFINADLDNAEKYIEQALDLAPQSAEIQFACGQIMSKQASDAIFSALSYANKSLDCFKSAVALAPTNIEYRSGLMSFYLGAPSIAGGDEELAFEQVQAIEKLDALRGARAKLRFFREIEDLKSFEVVLRKGVEAFPNHAEFYYRLGLFLQENKQYEEASQQFQLSIKAGIDDDLEFKLNAWYQVGRTALFSETNLEKGIAALQYFIDNSSNSSKVPSNEWANFRIAQLYRLANNKEKTSAHLALISDSSDESLLRAVKRFK